MKQLRTAKQLADAAGVTLVTVYDWIAKGWVIDEPIKRPTYTKRYVPVAEFDRVIQNRANGLPVDFGVPERDAALVG